MAATLGELENPTPVGSWDSGVSASRTTQGETLFVSETQALALRHSQGLQ